MFFEDDNLLGDCLGVLFMSGFYYCAREAGKQDALKQIADRDKDAKIADLQRQLNDAKRKAI